MAPSKLPRSSGTAARWTTTSMPSIAFNKADLSVTISAMTTSSGTGTG
eukprot:CAMPEP_0180800250 /NCGR_PEP_ID=MMETSP1038_2-20121128/58998_1 /TAXON_ID=632150 /ORGANISM="Azadinium spinosum, Strain 3D9" /LENGTH=47 /DNA_ID= /DNA_START= /DNA_END= /DNA_ORIENTATION=